MGPKGKIGYTLEASQKRGMVEEGDLEGGAARQQRQPRWMRKSWIRFANKLLFLQKEKKKAKQQHFYDYL